LSEKNFAFAWGPGCPCCPHCKNVCEHPYLLCIRECQSFMIFLKL